MPNDLCRKLGTKVWILNCDEEPERTGVLCGMAMLVNESREMHAVAMVRLDEGFYSPDPKTWVSILPVDPHYLSTTAPRYYLADEYRQRVPGFGARTSVEAVKAHVLERLNEDRASRNEPPYPDWDAARMVFEAEGWIILESEDE